MLSISRIHRFEVDQIHRKSLSSFSGSFGPQLHELEYKVIEHTRSPEETRITLQSYCVTGRGLLLPRLQVRYLIQDKSVYFDCDVKPGLLFSMWVYFIYTSSVAFGIVGPLFIMGNSGYPWVFGVWGAFVASVMLVWCRHLSRRELNRVIANEYIEQVYTHFVSAKVKGWGSDI